MKRDLPGHIRKAMRSVERFLPVVDLIVEMVDARMPEGSRMRGFVSRLNKASVVALAKEDLADPQETARWIEFYAEQGVQAIALNSRNARSVKHLAGVIRQTAFVRRPGQAVPQRRVRRVMVIGIPNVGKSTLINALAGRKAAQTANRPGVTRDVQWIKLSGDLELLDLPGILDFALLRRGDILKLINTLPGREEDPHEQAGRLLEALRVAGAAGHLPDFDVAASTIDSYLPAYALARHFLARGGEPDTHRAANDLIRRFQSGGFGRITLEKRNEHLEELLAPDE